MIKSETAPLESWIEECVTYLKETESFNVHRPHKDEFLLLYGIAARVMRYSDAYLHLVRLGLINEAVVLARAALEHAIALQWVFTVDGGIGRFQVDMAHDHFEHFSKLVAWLNHQEMAAELPAADSLPSGKRLPKFMGMLRDLDENNFLEMSYHILSQQVHVTHSAVASFLKQGSDEVHIDPEPQYGYQYPATYVVAISCMLARWVMAKLTDSPDLLEHLERVSNELHLPMALVGNLEEKKQRKGLSDVAD